LLSWKGSFAKVNDELGLAFKKRSALEGLFSSGRISQPVYESLNKVLSMEIEQVETRRKELASKITSRLDELERQMSALEMFLASVEMSYVAGEIPEELHSRESIALNVGIEAIRVELDLLKEAITQLVSPVEKVEFVTTAEPVGETSEEKPMSLKDWLKEAPPVDETASKEEIAVETTAEAPAQPVDEPVKTVTEMPAAAPTEAPVEPVPGIDEGANVQPAETITEPSVPSETKPEEQPAVETVTEAPAVDEATSKEEIAVETTADIPAQSVDETTPEGEVGSAAEPPIESPAAGESRWEEPADVEIITEHAAAKETKPEEPASSSAETEPEESQPVSEGTE